MSDSSLFYAYVHDNCHNRAVVVFASRYDADEWWRSICSLTNLTPNTFARISPQVYYYQASKTLGNGNYSGLIDFFHSQIYYNIIPSQLSSRFFITYDRETYYHQYAAPSQAFNIIPKEKIVDFLNGKSFYIRSNNDSKLFWNYPAGNAQGCNLSASITARTRFRVTAADTNLAKGIILIRSDKVIIQITSGLYVAVSEESGKLYGSDQPYEFLFGDLIGRKYDGVDESELEVSADGLGEAWELA